MGRWLARRGGAAFRGVRRGDHAVHDRARIGACEALAHARADFWPRRPASARHRAGRDGRGDRLRARCAACAGHGHDSRAFLDGDRDSDASREGADAHGWRRGLVCGAALPRHQRDPDAGGVSAARSRRRAIGASRLAANTAALGAAARHTRRGGAHRRRGAAHRAAWFRNFGQNRPARAADGRGAALDRGCGAADDSGGPFTGLGSLCGRRGARGQSLPT